MDLSNYIKDRNEAFKSMDKEKILAYCKKYNITTPEDDDIFWTGVHKAVCNLFYSKTGEITLEQYEKSYNWLRERGKSPSIVGGEK